MIPDARSLNLALQQCEREAGKLALNCLPVEIQLEATNRCRQACPTCARNFYDRDANPPGEMSYAVLEAIAPLFATAATVLVGGYGEPLLSETTFAILERARKAGCRTVIITGGGELSEEKALRLAEAELGEAVVSVDGATDESNRLRRGVGLHEVLANVARLHKLSPQTLLAFNVTLQVGNLDELPALVRLAQENDIAAVRVFHQKIYSATQATSSVFAVAAHAEKVFAQARAEAQRACVTLELPPLDDDRPCEQPYRLLAVRHDGVVQGCCSALFESHIPRLVLGRLPHDDPAELWNAPAMSAARQWAQGDGPDDSPCAYCAFRVFDYDAHQRHLDEANDE